MIIYLKVYAHLLSYNKQLKKKCSLKPLMSFDFQGSGFKRNISVKKNCTLHFRGRDLPLLKVKPPTEGGSNYT